MSCTTESEAGADSHCEDAVLYGVHTEQDQSSTAAVGVAIERRRPDVERRRLISTSASSFAQLSRTDDGLYLPHLSLCMSPPSVVSSVSGYVFVMWAAV